MSQKLSLNSKTLSRLSQGRDVVTSETKCAGASRKLTWKLGIFSRSVSGQRVIDLEEQSGRDR